MAQFTNQAQLSYNNTIVNSNTAVGEILDTLTVTKTAVGSDYRRGGRIAYTISLINNGTSPLTDVTVTDDLGMYTQNETSRYPLSYSEGSVRLFVNGVSSSAPTVTSDNSLVFSGITVPAGGNVIIVYETNVTEFASPASEGSITNTATVSGSCISANATASETVTASEEPELSITKSVDPTVVTGCSEINYTFVIENYGNSAADVDDNVILTDTFNPILKDISVTYNGDVWDASNYTYDETSGTFSSVAGKITVPAATFVQNTETGVWETTPGTVTLTVSGTI